MAGIPFSFFAGWRFALLTVLLYGLNCAPSQSAPANDNFTNRTVVSGSLLTISGTLAGATLETAESSPPFNSSSGGSVWYSWTAPASTRVVIESVRDYTNFSSSNTTFTAYTGTSIGALTAIDGNAFDWPAGRYAAFAATAGTTYTFRVAGGWGGPFSLKLTATNPPVFLKQPMDCVVSPFAGALFTAQAAGPRTFKYSKSDISYQWLSNGVPLPFETGASLLVTGASADKIANYSVIASNAGGITTSASATFAILATNTQPQVTVLRTSAPGQMALTLSGQLGRWYLVESSDDLANWPLTTLYPPTNMFYFKMTNQLLSLSLPRLLPVHYARASVDVRTDVCIGQLAQMRWAQQLTAIDNNMQLTAFAAFDQLKPYLPSTEYNALRACPGHGTYYPGETITNFATCTLAASRGHVIDP
jgi:hypothetical protein